MTKKIEWYKEVLELEPNSKLFFPLAKLLVDEGQYEEAISTLYEGAGRHPEYLEARLLLIELLYRTEQKDACNVEIRKLEKIFASYSSFWQAWAVCLEDKSADTASIIRFLAAHFVSGPLKLCEVINRGLISILNAEHPDRRGDKVAKEAYQNSAQAFENHCIVTENACSASPIEENAENEMPVNIENDKVCEETISLIPEQQIPADTYNNESEPDLKKNGGRTLLDTAEEVDDIGSLLASPETFALSPATAFPASSSIPEESISIRTRSMADILAEQGDIEGAIEIYRELAKASFDAIEARQLNQIIDSLTEKLHKQNKENTHLEPVESIVKKERLIGMLEELANRVEARIQG